MRIYKEIKVSDKLPDKEGTYTFASLRGIEQRHWIGDAADKEWIKTKKYWYEPMEVYGIVHTKEDFDKTVKELKELFIRIKK